MKRFCLTPRNFLCTFLLFTAGLAHAQEAAISHDLSAPRFDKPTGTFKQPGWFHRDSTGMIPDGDLCTQICYKSTLHVEGFDSSQTISGASDLLAVYVLVEHSYSGDLGFTLTCPVGYSVLLDGNDNNGPASLGIPDEHDSTLCDVTLNPPGSPWVYGWSSAYPSQGSLNSLDASTSPVPACDTVNHTAYFTPDVSLAFFQGCPLNGDWQLQVCDNFYDDNGYIFRWELEFNPALYPVTTGVPETSPAISLTLTPNPARDFLSVQTNRPVRAIRILDLSGRLLIHTQQCEIDCHRLENGLYLLIVETDTGRAEKLFTVAR